MGIALQPSLSEFSHFVNSFLSMYLIIKYHSWFLRDKETWATLKPRSLEYYTKGANTQFQGYITNIYKDALREEEVILSCTSWMNSLTFHIKMSLPL